MRAYLLLHRGHPRHRPAAAAGFVNAAGDLQCDVHAEAVVERARRQAAIRQLDRLGSDHDLVALGDHFAGVVAVTRADVHVQLLELGGLLALLGFEEVNRLAPDHAHDRALAGEHLDSLADQHLRIPAARADHVQEALVAHVADQQGDLVDVADDHEQRVLGAPAHARNGSAHGIDRDIRAEGVGGLAPNGRRSGLVPGRPGVVSRRSSTSGMLMSGPRLSVRWSSRCSGYSR